MPGEVAPSELRAGQYRLYGDMVVRLADAPEVERRRRWYMFGAAVARGSIPLTPEQEWQRAASHNRARLPGKINVRNCDLPEEVVFGGNNRVPITDLLRLVAGIPYLKDPEGAYTGDCVMRTVPRITGNIPRPLDITGVIQGSLTVLGEDDGERFLSSIFPHLEEMESQVLSLRSGTALGDPYGNNLDNLKATSRRNSTGALLAHTADMVGTFLDIKAQQVQEGLKDTYCGESRTFSLAPDHELLLAGVLDEVNTILDGHSPAISVQNYRIIMEGHNLCSIAGVSLS
jgi:hypothetical protein